MNDKGLYSVEEAAGWLGLGRTRTYEEIYTGRLRSVTVGRRRLVPVGALTEYVARLEAGAGVRG